MYLRRISGCVYEERIPMIQEYYFTGLCIISVVFGILAFFLQIGYYQLAPVFKTLKLPPQLLRERISEDPDLNQYEIWIIPSESESGLSGYSYGVFGNGFILLEENTLDRFDNSEIFAIIYHEIGHHMNKDLLKSAGWVGILAAGSIFSYGLGLKIAARLDIGLIIGTFFFACYLYVWMVSSASVHSRPAEYCADKIAYDKMKSGESMKSVLSTIDRHDGHPKSLSDLPIYFRYVERYPTNQERINKINEYD